MKKTLPPTMPEVLGREIGKDRCYTCGATYNCRTHYGIDAAPRMWFPDDTVHEFTHSLVIRERQYCCGAPTGTEHVATVSSYLAPVQENARMICCLVNQHRLAGRPQPQWLTDAWTRWEQAFTRPMLRDRILRA